jgi:hypothetical protein
VESVYSSILKEVLISPWRTSDVIRNTETQTLLAAVYTAKKSFTAKNLIDDTHKDKTWTETLFEQPIPIQLIDEEFTNVKHLWDVEPAYALAKLKFDFHPAM